VLPDGERFAFQHGSSFRYERTQWRRHLSAHAVLRGCGARRPRRATRRRSAGWTWTPC